MSELIMILGPMCSGKSFDLIGFFAPLKIAERKFKLVQPKLNCRDENIQSRNGTSLEAEKIEHITDLKDHKNYECIGIDEIHLFERDNLKDTRKDIEVINQLLKNGTKVIISGLNLDYKGEMTNIVKMLHELSPREIRMKTAVCTKCKSTDARFTQVLDKQGKPLLRGLGSRLPDDGTYLYEPRCRSCFERKNKQK